MDSGKVSFMTLMLSTSDTNHNK